MADVVTYKPEMDSNIISAVEDILKVKIVDSQRLLHGEQNFVYKLKTDKGIYIARIFKEKWWPEEDKYLWLETNLSKNSIPHAKLIYYDKSTKYFPFGFMILEFLDGINGEEAIKTGIITFKEFHLKLFKQLNDIHKVPIAGFGLIRNGDGEFKTYEEYKTAMLNEKIEEINKIPNFDFGLLKDVDSFSREVWKKVELSPVLTHGDATPDNSILTKDGEVILIDWDDARGGILFDDYAWILYCGSHITQEGSLEKRRELIFESSEELKSGHNLNELEKIYNITRAIELLPYYYFTQKNIKQYEYTLGKLKDNLTSFN